MEDRIFIQLTRYDIFLDYLLRYFLKEIQSRKRKKNEIE